MSRTFNPVYSSLADGPDITLCRVLEILNTGVTTTGGGGSTGTVTSASLATANASTVVDVTNFGTLAFQATGTWTGIVSISGSVDGTNYIGTTFVALTSGQSAGNFSAATIGQINTCGLTKVKFTAASSWSGTASLTFLPTASVSNIMLDNGLPSGSNLIGSVKDHNAGASGSTFFSGTTARTGTWYAIQVIADAVFNTLTASPSIAGDTFTGVTIPAGTIIYGNFTAITLTSGKVMAYIA